MTKECRIPNEGGRVASTWMLRALLGVLLACCWSAPVWAQSQPLKPTYWKQRLFFIPYQRNPQSKLLNPIAKVQLLTSRTGANDWAPLQEAKPNVQGFSYHAPEDGEYWFALRHLDRQGNPWPSAVVKPLMRIVVDTEEPEITLRGSSDVRGQVVIRYEARDANLQPTSLLVEVRGAGRRWSPLRLTTPDIAQPDRLVGRVEWRPPAGVTRVELRGAIADRAGHRGKTEAEFDLRGSVAEAGPEFPGASRTPFSPTKRLPSQDWPRNNQLAKRQAPPQSTPYAVGNQVRQGRTLAKLVGDGTAQAMQSLRMTPLDADHAPALVESTPWPSPKQDAWVPAASAVDFAERMVNSRTFDVEYDLESVGPWGVSKVELWGTQDNGRSWQSYGVDPDNRSPVRVTVPGTGVYGFRILVDGANSAGARPPQAGDEAELTVSVDLQPPTAELVATELGEGNLADHLLVRWTASDTNLEQRPIALFYSSHARGPWSTIASGLENTGSYTWRIERHVPGRFYLRLEVRDTAGNLATFLTPKPILLSRPQPMGRLRSVRPVE